MAVEIGGAAGQVGYDDLPCPRTAARVEVRQPHDLLLRGDIELAIDERDAVRDGESVGD